MSCGSCASCVPCRTAAARALAPAREFCAKIGPTGYFSLFQAVRQRGRVHVSKRSDEMKSKYLMFLCAAAFASCAEAEVFSEQNVSLIKGWNAVYLTVGPTNSASEVFSAWPVDWVAAYDPAMFQKTKQYSGEGSNEGTERPGYNIWRRGNDGVSTLFGVPAGSVYVCFATNAWNGIVRGVPRAPRFTWHKSSDEESMNFAGFSVYEPTTLEGYFSGLDVGNSTFRRYYGNNPADPTLGVVYQTETFGRGSVIVMDSKRVSDWSGVLYVSPASGIDFGDSVSKAEMSVRNDGEEARTVSVRIKAQMPTEQQLEIPTVPLGLKWRDASSAANLGEWADVSPSFPFSKSLEPGETLKLELALDRSVYASPAGTRYGALFEFKDVDGGSKMLVEIPVETTSDGGASAQTAWPKGVWIASAKLTNVSFVGVDTADDPKKYEHGDPKEASGYEENEADGDGKDVDIPISDIPAGGEMEVRLPMYVDGNRAMTLLQRFSYGRDAEGTLHAYAGTVTNFPVKLSGVSRVSTAFLPTDVPLVHAGQSSLFGGTATFPFTVAEHSGVNPMRHAYHPQHDGLDFDFRDKAPTGDNLANYISTVKPELFSITNAVTFTWDETAGTSWNPDETLTGTLVWEFTGLRHEGALRASGKFTMKRISPVSIEW